MKARAGATLLAFRGLRKRRADDQPLLDIDNFSIPVGGCVLLTGCNGAGKTTLLKIIAGLESPDCANVDIDGVTQIWREALRRYARNVIYLHQQPYLFDCTVAENVGYGLRGKGLARREIARRVDWALETAALAHLAERNARELSGGERQRVALTRALVLAPRLLLLDEPLANLDEGSRERTLALLRELKLQRIAVLITSHERLSLAMLADYHYELSDGRLTLLDGTAEFSRPAIATLDNVIPYESSRAY